MGKRLQKLTDVVKDRKNQGLRMSTLKATKEV